MNDICGLATRRVGVNRLFSRLRSSLKGYSEHHRACFRTSWDTIAETNLQMLRLASALITAVLVLYLITAFIFKRGTDVFIAYGVGITFSTGMALYTRLRYRRLRWRTILTRALCMLFLLVITALTIYISTVGLPDRPSLYYSPMVILLSLLFIMPFWHSVLLVGTATAIFLLISASVKAPSVFVLDVSMAMTTLVLSLVANFVVLTSRLRDHRLRSELKALSCTDSLTGLMNKSTAEEAARAYLAARAMVECSALFVIDLDQFKQLNDLKGHQAGDTALEQFGEALQGLFRSQDIVGRVGGDEFIALMKNVGDRRLVMRRAALICETVRRANPPESGNQLTCSVGVALCPAHGVTYDSLFRKADEQLYCVKREGRDGFRLAD